MYWIMSLNDRVGNTLLTVRSRVARAAWEELSSEARKRFGRQVMETCQVEAVYGQYYRDGRRIYPR